MRLEEERENISENNLSSTIKAIERVTGDFAVRYYNSATKQFADKRSGDAKRAVGQNPFGLIDGLAREIGRHHNSMVDHILKSSYLHHGYS